MRSILSILLLLVATAPCFSQARHKEERKEAQDEKKSATRDKVDYTLFRRQILTLTEFSDQRRKLAELKKEGKGMAKIFAVVDSLNENADGKFLTGYIQLVLGDNIVNVYELTFDRSVKRIILVKSTGEQLEVEKEARSAPGKPATKAKPKKKKSEDDDEEDEEEEEKEEKEKPVKGKQKDDED